jgi:hypothetical protein
LSQKRGNYLPPSNWDAEAASPLPEPGARVRFAKMTREERVALAKRAIRIRWARAKRG